MGAAKVDLETNRYSLEDLRASSSAFQTFFTLLVDSTMHSLDLLQIALETAKRQGFTIRREWLGGVAGGKCRLGNKKILFVDISLSVLEQLQQVTNSLATESNLPLTDLDPALERVIRATREAMSDLAGTSTVTI